MAQGGGREKRRHTRVRMQTVGLVVVHSDQGEILGRVVDLSQGGLALQYVPCEDPGPEMQAAYVQCWVDVHLREEGIFLERLPGNMVYDVWQPLKYSWSQIQLKKCAVQFENIDPEQCKMLCKVLNEVQQSENDTIFSRTYTEVC